MDYLAILNEIHASVKLTKDKGEVASYIPELAKVRPDQFGINLLTTSKSTFSVGQSDVKFSIQSISKVLSLAKAASILGTEILKRVDVEPSGNPFNHLSLLEQEKGIPRNPLINSGALVIADMLISHLEHPKEEFLAFVRALANDNNIDYDTSIAKSEQETGFKNYAAAYLLKSYGNLHNSVDEVLDFYFHQCALAMTCEQLSNAFFLFANGGKCLNGNVWLAESQVKRINAIMMTCGFYDEAGEFAFEVGLPGKSGVGGGIVAVLPRHYVITVWSPGLNEKGNSKLGMHALEQFTTKSKLTIF